jgi:predicted RND superfamily exporter protein
VPVDYKEKIDRWFKAFAIQVIRYRKAVMLVAVLAVGLLSLYVPRLSIVTTLESSFSTRNRAIQDYQKFRDQFGRDEQIILLVKSEDIFSPEFLVRFKQFHEDLENTLPLVSEVNSLINAPYIEKTGGELTTTIFLDDLPQTEDESRILRKKALGNALFRNYLLTEDGRSMIVVIKTQAVSALTEDGRKLKKQGRGIGPSDLADPVPGQKKKSISQVENIAILGHVDAVIKQYNTDNFRIFFSGTPVYQFEVEPIIRHNMKKMSIMVFVMTFFFMAILFRRVSGIFLPQFVVIMGLAATLGLMAIFEVPFTLTSSMLPSIILSVGLTAPIHFMVVFFKYQKKIGRFRAIITTLGHSGMPIALTSLTTIASLLAFSLTEIAPVAHLGIFSAIGITICLLLTLFFLPALLSILEVLPGGEREKLYEASIYSRTMIWLGRFGVRQSRDVYILIIISTLIILPGALRVNFSHNMLHYFDENSGFMRQTRLIEDEIRGFRGLEILVDTNRENGIFEYDILETLGKLDAFVITQTDYFGKPYVEKTLSTVDIIKEANKASHKNIPPALQLPEDKVGTDRHLTELQSSSAGLLERFTNTSFSQIRYTAMMFWNDAAVDVEFLHDLEAKISDLFDKNVDVIVTGAVSISSRVIDSMMSNLAIGYIVAFGIIVLFMIVAVGDVKLGLVAMVPNMIPIVFGLGIMGHMDIPLNTYNLIGGSIVIGVAVDDTIHFFHNFRHYYKKTGDVETAVTETLRTAGRALLTTTLILVSCFWLRLFSPLKVISDFGLVMGCSLLIAFLADVLMAPALLEMMYGNRTKKVTEAISSSGVG